MLIASMVGSKIASSMPRLSVAQNEAEKHVAPVISFLPFRNKETIETATMDAPINNGRANAASIEAQFAPLKVRRAGTNDPWFTFPFEPLISVGGKNNIVKRSIAKAPNFIGSVKEHWSQDDYTITITGFLFGDVECSDFEKSYPRADFEKIRDYCISPTGLEVECDMLQILGIQRIVIEDFSFPFSKGENVQAFDIKALSDWTGTFLLEIID